MLHRFSLLFVAAAVCLLSVACEDNAAKGAASGGAAATASGPAAVKGGGFSVVAEGTTYTFEPRKKGGYRVKRGADEVGKINTYPDKVKLKAPNEAVLVQVKKKDDGGFAVVDGSDKELLRGRGGGVLELKSADGQVQATVDGGRLAVSGVEVKAAGAGGGVAVARGGAVVATVGGAMGEAVAAAFALPGLDPPAQAAVAVFLAQVR